MAASLVTMMMGAAQSAAQGADEGKSAGPGKSFAESLDERMAADADEAAKMGAGMSASLIKDGTQASTCAVEQKKVGEPIVTANISQIPDDGGQTASIPPIKERIVMQTPGAQNVAVMTGNKAPTADSPAPAAIEGAELKTAAEQASAMAVDDPANENTRPLDGVVIADPKAAGDVSGEESRSTKVRSTGETPDVAQVDVSAASAFPETNAPLISTRQECVPVHLERNASTDSGEDVASPKGTVKKHAPGKAENPMKTVNGRTSVGIFSGVTPAVVGAAIVANTAGSNGATNFTTQTVAKPSSKQESVTAAMTGRQAAAVTSGGAQNTTQSTAPEKPGGGGIGVATKPTADTHAAQKAVQKDLLASAKPEDTSIVAAAQQGATQAVKPAAKVQTSDASVTVSHSVSVAGATVTATAANAGSHVPVFVAPKSLSGDAPATLPASHSGNGELPGASGAQTALNETHRTLVATPTVLEVGIPNGTQGWLKVRAELTSGGVNASLSAASPTGQEMLHRELPALTTYLQQEKVVLNSLVIQTPAAGGFRGLSGGPAGYSGGQPQQRDQGNSGRNSFFQPGGATHSATSVQASEDLPGAVPYPIGGGWLSVRA